MKFSSVLMATGMLIVSLLANAGELKINDPAPLFVAKNQDGKDFDLGARKGLWTVLYFYPKSGTSGCTKQAKGFQEQLVKIRVQGADVFGISMNTVSEQAAFRKDENLRFTLLADPDAKVVDLYGARLFPARQSKRWTFIIDPDLVIRDIQKDVDPSQNPEIVVSEIIRLKSERAQANQKADSKKDSKLKAQIPPMIEAPEKSEASPKLEAPQAVEASANGEPAMKSEPAPENEKVSTDTDAESTKYIRKSVPREKPSQPPADPR